MPPPRAESALAPAVTLISPPIPVDDPTDSVKRPASPLSASPVSISMSPELPVDAPVWIEMLPEPSSPSDAVLRLTEPDLSVSEGPDSN